MAIEYSQFSIHMITRNHANPDLTVPTSTVNALGLTAIYTRRVEYSCPSVRTAKRLSALSDVFLKGGNLS